MSIFGISRVLSVVQPMIGLVLVVMSLMLLRRKADPAVWFILVWGGLRLIGGLWEAVIQSYYLDPTGPILIPLWINVVSGVQLIGGVLFSYVTVFYAVWRFWRASGDAGNSK